MGDERRRRVLELTFEGASIAEIREELAVSQANAYQLRTRAFRDLTKLKEQYDA
jgi:DNA-directed RNA polymerase specialized sigma subunit